MSRQLSGSLALSRHDELVFCVADSVSHLSYSCSVSPELIRLALHEREAPPA